MAKAKRAMCEDIKLIDIIVELLDARAPYSTRNPDIEGLGSGNDFKRRSADSFHGRLGRQR